MITSTQELKLAPRRGASAVFLLATLAAASAQAAVSSGSTGADGAFNPTVNTEVVLPASGILNYTTVNIPTGVTVKFKKNVANTPVYILASGNVSIAGTIDLRGEDAKPTGTYGDGALGDDGQPGAGGPGGYEGGRGGLEDAAQRANIIRGGTGLGPGGGPGGIEGGSNCSLIGYYPYEGVGGGYATNAYQSGGYRYNCGEADSAKITAFGRTYGSALLQPLLGGSGGGGGKGGPTFPGSGGGGGGGAILIASSGTLSITGSIQATGGDGGGVAGTGSGNIGAGGSGGAIRLVATTIAGNGVLNADGGCINYSNSRRQYCGANANGGGQHGGSVGRIRLEAEAVTYSGSVTPAYTADLPGPIFISGSPSIRIASVAGQNVPANPTGNADVTLPATTTSAVAVVFQTVNVPVGNTVLLRVVPAYGLPIEALSPAISGATASGTATVSVTLPQGPSTLQATTTYTVVVGGTTVAGAADLSKFAKNEAVEKVEVTVPMVGEVMARLYTVSGKTYDVSYEALRAAGFQG